MAPPSGIPAWMDSHLTNCAMGDFASLMLLLLGQYILCVCVL